MSRGQRGRGGRSPKRWVPVTPGYVSECRHGGTIHITGGECSGRDRTIRHAECPEVITAAHPDFNRVAAAATGDCSVDCLERCAHPGQFSECTLDMAEVTG